MTTNKKTNRHLTPGTRVVNCEDAEPGQVICTLDIDRRGQACSYIIQTAYGREVWAASAMFVPEQV